MLLWEKILQLALLGSERSHLEPAVEESLRQYHIDPEDPLPQVILSGAATLNQLRKLQTPAEPYTKPLPAPANQEEQDHTLSARSLLHLKQILSGHYQRVLPEFVDLLVSKQLLLPPEFLPELLNDCLQDQRLWSAIQPLLGTRAEWLIAQHPAWQRLLPQGDPSRWEEAGYEERKQILGYLRRQAPEKKAVSFLESIWKTTPFKKKLVFLTILETGLGPTDECFLEIALKDSRKEVRLKAADLLARIPGSNLIKQIFDQVHSLFTFELAKKRVEVDLPKEIPTKTVEYGIQPKVKKGKRGGLKVSWLTECVSRIPVSYWMEHFGCSMEELITAFDRSNRGELLLSALGESSLRFRNNILALHLIRYLVLKNRPMPAELNWQGVAKQIPVTEIQSVAETYFQQQPGLLEEHHLLTKILVLGQHPWSVEMAGHIIQGLKQWMAESKTFLWNLWHYKALLETAGYCSPLSLLEELGGDWPVHSPVWNQWAPDVERMLQIMRFRRAVRGEG